MSMAAAGMPRGGRPGHAKHPAAARTVPATWLLPLVAGFLLAGCGTVRHYATDTSLGGQTLTLFPDGTVELGRHSAVITDNCIFVGLWTRVGSRPQDHRLEFHSARGWNGEEAECATLPETQTWQVSTDLAVSPGGSRLQRREQARKERTGGKR